MLVIAVLCESLQRGFIITLIITVTNKQLMKHSKMATSLLIVYYENKKLCIQEYVWIFL